MPTFAGIDPGKKGHIAIIDASGVCLEDHKMPFTGKDLNCAKLASILSDVDGIALERVWAMPGGGERKPGASSTFSFGLTYGAIWATVTLTGIPLLNPTPQSWQKAIIGKRPKGQSTKEASRFLAAEKHAKHAPRFRKVKASADFADALHLAEFARLHFLQGAVE